MYSSRQHMRSIFALAMILLVSFAAKAEEPFRLNETDYKAVAEFAKLLSAGNQKALLQPLSEAKYSSVRLENAVTVIYLLVADIRLEEAEGRVGSARAAGIKSNEGREQPDVTGFPPTDEQLRKSLLATRADVDRHLARYLSAAEVKSARKQINARRKEFDPLFDFLQGQSQ